MGLLMVGLFIGRLVGRTPMACCLRAKVARRPPPNNSIIQSITKSPNHPITKSPACALPVLVLRSVERCSIECGEHVEHVLAAPVRGVWLVLIRAHSPVGPMRPRVGGN